MEPSGVQMLEKGFNNLFTKPYIKAEEVSQQLFREGKDGSRSSKRTDILNEETINIIKDMIDAKNLHNYEFKTEQSIVCSRGDKFKVDVAVFYKGSLRAVLLLKAVVKSYNKNRHNYTNTIEGEMARLFDVTDRKGVHAITIDWIPREVPAGDKFETTKIPNSINAENRWNMFLKHRQCSASFCKIVFDYDIKNNIAKNVNGSEKLTSAIQSFLL